MSRDFEARVAHLAAVAWLARRELDAALTQDALSRPWSSGRRKFRRRVEAVHDTLLEAITDLDMPGENWP